MPGIIFPASLALICTVVALLVGTPPAQALTVQHNGVGTGGIITAATEDTSVSLRDASSEFPDLCFFTLGPEGTGPCLAKVWPASTLGDAHSLTVTPGAVESSIILIEFIGNYTGTGWSDYHIAVEGAAIQECNPPGSDRRNCEATLFTLNALSHELTFFALVPFVHDGSSVTFFFPELFVTPTGFDELVFGFLVTFGDFEGPFLITQHPTLPVPEPPTLAPLGLGLVGLAVLYYRRRKQPYAV